eukprot:5992599-Alexandrium_andersonii.AAC.1
MSGLRLDFDFAELPLKLVHVHRFYLSPLLSHALNPGNLRRASVGQGLFAAGHGMNSLTQCGDL